MSFKDSMINEDRKSKPIKKIALYALVVFLLSLSAIFILFFILTTAAAMLYKGRQ